MRTTGICAAFVLALGLAAQAQEKWDKDVGKPAPRLIAGGWVGTTPMIEYAWPSRLRRRPMTWGSRPKCACQNSWLSITTSGPRSSSSERNARPRIGCTPTTVK